MQIVFSSAQDFKIIEAKSQKWTAGRAKSGYGTNYNISLVCTKTIRHPKFDKLWVGTDALEVIIARDLADKKRFAKNDTIKIAAVKRVKTDEYGDPITEEKSNVKSPINFDNSAALLTYKTCWRNKNLLIPTIKKQKKVFHP